jgi:hypothetical protein
MFINNSKSNWEMYSNAARYAETQLKKAGKEGVVKRIESTTNEVLREVERVVTGSPSEGNFTPLVIGNMMATDIVKLVVDTVMSITKKRPLENNDIADISSVIAADYTIALANLAYQKVEPRVLAKQLDEMTA